MRKAGWVHDRNSTGSWSKKKIINILSTTAAVELGHVEFYRGLAVY
jgi:hypothetical protein